MASSREAAINNEYEKNRNGRPSFEYVNTQMLDRLGITKYKTESSDNFIRIMPPKNEEAMWAKEVWVHRNIGANGVTMVCPKKMDNEPCPVCEMIEEMKNTGATEDEIRAIAASKRYLLFIYDVKSDETIAKGLRWYDAPGIVVTNIILLSKDKRTKEIIDVCDPVDGRDIEFVRKGSGLNSKYEAFNLVKTQPIPSEWYANVPDFDDVLLRMTYQQMKAELLGSFDSDLPSNQQEREESVTESETCDNTRQSSAKSRRLINNTKPEPDVEQNSIKDRIEEIKRRRGI